MVVPHAFCAERPYDQLKGLLDHIQNCSPDAILVLIELVPGSQDVDSDDDSVASE